MTPHIFANGPHLVALKRLRATKAHLRQKGVCSHSHHLTFYDSTQYLSLYPSNGQESKKIPFFIDFPIGPQKEKFQARVRSILMAPTFHI